VVGVVCSLEDIAAAQDRYHLVGVTTTWWMETIFDTGPLNATGSAVSAGVWYHIGIIRGAVAQRTDVYVDGTLQLQLTDDLSWTPDILRFMNDSFDDWVDGRIQHVKFWEAALTTAELDNERFVAVPQRTANLAGWWPCLDQPTGSEDWSGLGRNLTQTGTLTTEDGPPVSWGVDAELIIAAAAAAPYVPPGGFVIELQPGS